MNKFNLTEEDIIYLENKLEGLFEKFKASANSLMQVQEREGKKSITRNSVNPYT